MTATASDQDVKDMKDCIGLREEEIVVLRASPVQGHVKYQTVRRPPNGVVLMETSLAPLVSDLVLATC